jgi:hypothetical protein
MVQIIYEKSTAIQMGSRLTMTWVDYFSAVGESLGWFWEWDLLHSLKYFGLASGFCVAH